MSGNGGGGGAHGHAGGVSLGGASGVMYPMAPSLPTMLDPATGPVRPGDVIVREVNNGWIVIVIPPYGGGLATVLVAASLDSLPDVLKAAVVTAKVT